VTFIDRRDGIGFYTFGYGNDDGVDESELEVSIVQRELVGAP
jgi:hypothetical protein